MNEILLEIKKYVSELKIPGVNQGLKMSIDLRNIKLDKNKKSMIKKILNDDRTYLIGVVILGIATLVICTLMIVGVL